jgi:hypothetical protein
VSTPDQLHTSRLQAAHQPAAGSSARLARDGGRIDDAVQELQHLAAGRTDLIAQAAGILGGTWTVHAATEPGYAPIAAGLLILTGPDRDQLQAWLDTARARATQQPMLTAGDHRPPTPPAPDERRGQP